jgi:hypothetical protein
MEGSRNAQIQEFMIILCKSHDPGQAPWHIAMVGLAGDDGILWFLEGQHRVLSPIRYPAARRATVTGPPELLDVKEAIDCPVVDLFSSHLLQSAWNSGNSVLEIV